jgi:hypothetical protein
MNRARECRYSLIGFRVKYIKVKNHLKTDFYMKVFENELLERNREKYIFNIFSHILSHSLLFFHILSYSLTFSPILSHSLLFSHILSYSFTFSPILSHSLLFFHILSISLLPDSYKTPP